MPLPHRADRHDDAQVPARPRLVRMRHEGRVEVGRALEGVLGQEVGADQRLADRADGVGVEDAVAHLVPAARDHPLPVGMAVRVVRPDAFEERRALGVGQAAEAFGRRAQLAGLVDRIGLADGDGAEGLEQHRLLIGRQGEVLQPRTIKQSHGRFSAS